ncbi:hypothetical protein T03_14035 [Trichinella britovi]|uniref:Uncharacterized protein n=1 Tax=Trichinella britovi TaxID=45882 RepID=A0A0V1ALM5_TRIBR|nr:hypothetical protein T03_14035 [Trichinella britovi]
MCWKLSIPGIGRTSAENQYDQYEEHEYEQYTEYVQYAC